MSVQLENPPGVSNPYPKNSQGLMSGYKQFTAADFLVFMCMFISSVTFSLLMKMAAKTLARIKIAGGSHKPNERDKEISHLNDDATFIDPRLQKSFKYKAQMVAEMMFRFFMMTLRVFGESYEHCSIYLRDKDSGNAKHNGKAEIKNIRGKLAAQKEVDELRIIKSLLEHRLAKTSLEWAMHEVNEDGGKGVSFRK